MVFQLLSRVDSLRPHGLQHAKLPCPLLSHTVCSNSCPLSQGCYPIISSSATPFSFSPQSFPASESFPMSQLFIKWPKQQNFNISHSNKNSGLISFQFTSVAHAAPWIAARQASLSITNSRSLLNLMSIESVMPSNHLILSYPLLLLPPIFPSIRVFSNESVLCIRWPKYWSFSFSISPSN